MADYAKINDVPAANIAKYANVPKANIANVGGAITTPSSGATRWAIASIDQWISWANAADIDSLSTWEDNAYRLESQSADTLDIAYGLNHSDGSAQWMMTGLGGSDEIRYDGNNDITDESAWTSVNTSDGGRKIRIVYGVGDGASDSSSGSAETRVSCWLAVGRNTSSNIYVHRSVDSGANWTAINLHGITNVVGGSSDDWIRGIASDGQGTWMLGSKGNLIISTDSGVSWAYLIQPTGNGTHLIRDIQYTNGTWVVITKQSAELHVSTCVGSTVANMDASGDWSASTKITDGTDDLNGNAGVDSVEAAAAGGNVVVMDGVNTQAFTVSGKTISFQGDRQAIPLTETPANCIATDGTTWLIGCGGTGDNGDIIRSTDNGANWALIVENLSASGVTPVMSIAPNVVLPL